MAVHTVEMERGEDNVVAVVEHLTDSTSMWVRLGLETTEESCKRFDMYCTQKLSHAWPVEIPLEELDTTLDCKVDEAWLQDLEHCKQAVVDTGFPETVIGFGEVQWVVWHLRRLWSTGKRLVLMLIS